MKRGEFVFLGSEAWARDGTILAKDTNHIILGSFTVSLEMYKDRELRNHVQNIKPKPYRTDPWAMMFIQAKRNCFYDLSFDKTQADKCSVANDHSRDPDFTLDTYDTQAYVATKCLLTGADAFLKTKCGSSASSLCKDFLSNTEGLVEEILKTKMDLDGSGSKMKVFNRNGDGNIGYRIYNIQKDDVDPSTLVYKEIGRYPLEGTFTFETDKIVYPNDMPLRSKCPNEQACINCFARIGNNVKNVPGTPQEDTIATTALAAVLGTLLGIAIVTGAVLAAILCTKRRKEQDNKNDILLRTNMTYSQGEVIMKREEVTPSKIYMEIPAQREQRYVRMNNQTENPSVDNK
ncbi:uncharacterized protein LOC128553856 [Mercenaria mercenaria]|uniref:uncharacterized protein LOC128553856 n=1 Tax=Mercenaria mercenaria TaxID=6596 RepID=UPI00234EA85B|nr:uncharacterized protein LOC128553856 [Mercenaria mercenaria]